MKNDYTILFEKKLGKYLLLELEQNNRTGELTITLYKKWSEASIFESTDNCHTFRKEEREKAISIFDGINLKNVYSTFKRIMEVK